MSSEPSPIIREEVPDMSYEIRAMSIGEVLDTGFRLVRNNFLQLCGIGLAISLPAQVLATWLSQLRTIPDAASIGAMVAMGLTLFVVSPIVGAAITHAVSEAYLGRDVKFWDSLALGRRLLLRLMGTALLMSLLIALGVLLLILPGLYLMLCWLLIYQVMVIEDRAGWDALKRTRELSSGQLWRILGVYVVALLVWGLLIGVLGLVTAGFPMLSVLVSSLAQAVFSAYVAAAFVVMYFDIRCRKEAFDLEHLANLVSGDDAPVPAASRA